VAKKGKPRVAGSARGRELRAAAALARFEPVKKEEVNIKEEPQSESETEDEYEEGDAEGAAIDVDGKKMLDGRGRALVKICEDEDGQDEDSRREMAEFQDIQRDTNISTAKPTDSKNESSTKTPIEITRAPSSKAIPEKTSSGGVIHLDEIYKRRPEPEPTAPKRLPRNAKSYTSSQNDCIVCSLLNEPGSLTCAACSNVLNPNLVPDHWRCQRTSCKDSQYINSGDAGVCGLCGALRSA
jgi:hypothetical protein